MTVTIDGVAREISPDYNNCDFMFAHKPGEQVRRDVYAQEQSIFLQYTCCRPATNKSTGIVALTKAPDNPDFPIAVGANDFANCNKDTGIVR